ncbi:MAG: diguanylate cyclase [Acidimicrobiales bacterium]
MRVLVAAVIAALTLSGVVASSAAVGAALQEPQVEQDWLYLSAVDLYYDAARGEIIDPATGEAVQTPIPTETLLDYQALAERHTWPVPQELRSTALWLLLNEITLLVELDAFATEDARLALVNKALPPNRGSTDELLADLDAIDSQLESAKAEILTFLPRPLGPAGPALDSTSSIMADSLASGATRILPAGSHIAALSVLVSQGAAPFLQPEDRGIEFVALAPKLEDFGADVLFEDRFVGFATPDERVTTPVLAIAVAVALAAVVGLAARAWSQHTRSMRELAYVDSMTTLWNRRRLDQDLSKTVADAERTASPIAFAMVDVDHFKQFNDTHGHAAGDMALRDVAETIAGNVRDEDVVYRYGGEEFSVLLPNTSTDDAMDVAERVRAAVERACISGPGGTRSGTLTVSVGVAEFTGVGISEMTACADKALYQAKQSGRNRVKAWTAFAVS